MNSAAERVTVIKQRQTGRKKPDGRKHKRHDIDFNVMVTRDGRTYLRASTVNLSLSGISICHLDPCLTRGDKVYLELSGVNDSATQLFIGKVIYTQIEKQGSYVINVTGIEFDRQNSGHHQIIRQKIIMNIFDRMWPKRNPQQKKVRSFERH